MSEQVVIHTMLDFMDESPSDETLREIQEAVGEAINTVLLTNDLPVIALPPQEWVGLIRGEGGPMLPLCEGCGQTMTWDPRMAWWHCPHDEESWDDRAGEMGEAIP